MKTKTSDILKRLCTATFAFLVCLSAWAVPGTAKQINEIKRSGAYFHAESTAESQQEATDAATQMLAYYINEYIKDNSLSIPNVSADNIPGVKYLEVKRGTNTRVFAYVERNVILGGEAPAPVPQAQPEAEPYAEPQTVTEPESSQSIQGNQGTQGATVESYADDNDYSPDGSYTETNETVVSPLVRTYTTALAQLYGAEDLQAAVGILNRLQAERIVKRYGPANKCVNKSWSFWMVYDSSGKILEAFLSPGAEGERYNFVSDTDNDSLSNHTRPGKTALFFEFW